MKEWPGCVSGEYNRKMVREGQLTRSDGRVGIVVTLEVQWAKLGGTEKVGHQPSEDKP